MELRVRANRAAHPRDGTAWTVTQNTTFGAMFADKSGNIWVEERGMPSRVLLRVNHATATPFTTRWLTHVIGIDRDTGFVLGGQSNYLAKNGLVESFDRSDPTATSSPIRPTSAVNTTPMTARIPAANSRPTSMAIDPPAS